MILNAENEDNPIDYLALLKSVQTNKHTEEIQDLVMSTKYYMKPKLQV